MKRLILFLIALCPLAAFAQGGSEALPFVRTDIGPILTGTAGAAVASQEAGPWSAFHSAAAITMSESQTIAGLDVHLIGTFAGGGAAFSFKPADNLGVAIGAMYQSGDKIGDYRTSDFLVSAGAGFKVSEAVSVGANARFARQSLTQDVSYSGVGLDLSVMGRLNERMSAIAGVSSLGGKVTSASGTKYSQPANVYAGIEAGTEIMEGVLSADAMAEYYFSGSYAAAAGVSYVYQEALSVHLGYRYASQWCVMPSRFAAGVGYSFGSISLDASFVRMTSQNQNIIALGIGYKL